MEKPVWRIRASSYVVDTPYLRLRKDEIELPDGTVIPDYYVRESHGFVMIFALTPALEVVLVRQYRYGNDSIGIELPAGTLDPGEDPLDCAKRELLEETGFTAERWEKLALWAAEPVRATTPMHAFLAYDARATHAQQLDATEHIDVVIATLDETRAMLRDGRIASVSCVAHAYAALDDLGATP